MFIDPSAAPASMLVADTIAFLRLKCLHVRTVLGGLLAGLLLASLPGCAESKLVRHRQLSDNAGQAVDYVCVVPLYGKMTGVSFAFKGGNRNATVSSYLMHPFKFHSGEDFAAQIIPNEAHVIFIPELMAFAIGDAVSPLRFLLVREGFEPLLLRGHEKHMREPLILRRSTERLPGELIELLTEQRDDQTMLRKYFKPNESIREIRFDYTSSDAEVVRACLGQ